MDNRLLEIFAALPREGVALGAAGKLYTASDCERAIEAGLDFVFIGRAAVVHANFAEQALANPDFAMADLPVREPISPPRAWGQNLSITWRPGTVSSPLGEISAESSVGNKGLL